METSEKRPDLVPAFTITFRVDLVEGDEDKLTAETIRAAADTSGAEDALATSLWAGPGPGVAIEHGRVVLCDVAREVDHIESAEDFISALGDAIEGGQLPGVLGLDDEGKQIPDVVGGDAHLLSLLLNDDEETRIYIAISDVPWTADTKPTRMPRRAKGGARG